METPQIAGAESVVEWFGAWPDFHDAEVLEINLLREGRSSVVIHAWRTTGEIDTKGCYVRDRDAVIAFAFERIQDLELADFSEQNVVASISCETKLNGHRLTLSPCFGVAGYIEAERVSVSIQPGKPASLEDVAK